MILYEIRKDTSTFSGNDVCYLFIPVNSPLGATFTFPLALLLLSLQSAKTAMSTKPMTVNIPTPAPHFQYTIGNICPSFQAVLRAFHVQ